MADGNLFFSAIASKHYDELSLSSATNREKSDSKQYSKFIEGKKERERKLIVIYVRDMKKTV